MSENVRIFYSRLGIFVEPFKTIKVSLIRHSVLFFFLCNEKQMCNPTVVCYVCA